MTVPILLVPGLNCTPEIWALQMNALWARGPVTVARHTQGETIAEIARTILADAPPRFALAGISMGGYVAFELWRQAPGRIMGLAFVDTSARPDAPEATARRRTAMELARAGRFPQVIANAFPFAVHPDHLGDERVRGIHMRMALASGVETYLRQQEAIIGRADSRHGLAEINVPTAVIVGDRDQLTPPELSQEIADGIAGATLTTVPEAGHLALVEQPEAATAALLAWLDRVAAGQGR